MATVGAPATAAPTPPRVFAPSTPGAAPAAPPPGAFDLLPAGSKPPASAPPPIAPPAPEPGSEVDTLTPAQPPPNATRPSMADVPTKYFVVASVVLLALAVWFMWPRGGGGDSDSSAVKVLDPIADSDLPGVQDAIRIQAESNLHVVTQAMSMQFAQSGSVATITPDALA
ncbi:MAG TPA: hypothetical protein VFX21_08705, partial [Acidimicrobiia bacterium]|nr:hypothetical protein [Acidimicrobiia bacterium]